MGTTDANGIYMYDDTDGAPTPPVLNVGQQSVSDALSSLGEIHSVANQAERNALALSRTITNTSPLYVERRDTGAIERTFDGTTWVRVAGTSLSSYQTSGSVVPSIEAPPANVPSIPQIITKYGKAHFFTDPAFGNGYGPTVTFQTPFPTACLNVSLTQLQTSGPTTAPVIALDLMTASLFRAFYPGAASVSQRAYLWTATGY